MNEQMERTLIAGNWSMMCRSAEAHAAAMARMCLPQFAELIHREVPRFTNLATPQTQEEMRPRNQLSIALSSKIGSIAHASAMAKLHPEVAADIHRLTDEFCQQIPLDGEVAMHSITLSSAISTACHSATMRRMTQ